MIRNPWFYCQGQVQFLMGELRSHRPCGVAKKTKQNCMQNSFFKKFIYFNWRLITLQYCSCFCHIFTWISHGCPCVPHLEPPSSLPPMPSLRVIPVHQPWAPCLMHWTWTGDLFQNCFNCIILASLVYKPFVFFVFWTVLWQTQWTWVWENFGR